MLLRRLASLLLLFSLVGAAGLVGLQYWKSGHPALEVIIDARSYRGWAEKAGRHFPEVLAELQRSGATAAAVGEQSLDSLEQEGLLRAMTGSELRQGAAGGSLPLAVLNLLRQGAIQDGYTYLLGAPTDVVALLGQRVGAERVRELAPGSGLIELALPGDLVDRIPLGFKPADFDVVRQAGLRPVPRPGNFPKSDADSVARVFADLDRHAPDSRMVIFQGNEALGYPDALAATAAELSRRGWGLGMVQQSPPRGRTRGKVEQLSGPGYIVQKGQELLADLVGYRVVRVASEPYPGVGALYVREIAPDQVRSLVSGLRTGPAEPFDYVYTGRSVRSLLTLGAAAAAILLFNLGWVPTVALGAAVLVWPYLAPGAGPAVGVGSGALVLALLSALAGERRAGALLPAWFAAGGAAAGVLSLALRSRAVDWLGMVRQPAPTAYLSAALLAAAAWYAWTYRKRLRWDADVGLKELLAGSLAAGSIAFAFLVPGWAPVLLAGAGAGAGPGLGRWAGRTAGLVGAAAIAAAPVGAWTTSAIGLAVGVALGVILERSGAVVNARRRETA